MSTQTVVGQCPVKHNTSGDSATRQTANFSPDPTSGNTIIVFITGYFDTDTPSITDTAGNVYTLDRTYANTSDISGVLWVFRSSGIVGGANFKVTAVWSGVGKYTVMLGFEIAGQLNYLPIDAAVDNHGSSATPVTAALTTTNANDLLVIFESDNGSGIRVITAPGAPWTQLGQETGNTYKASDFEYKIVSSIQSGITSSWTLDSSQVWSAMAIAYKAFGPPVFPDVGLASNSGYQTGSSYSWNHTCYGPNSYLLVGVSFFTSPGGSVTSLTYNGDAMTQLGVSINGAIRSELWGLANPANGTNSIDVTLSEALESVGTAFHFINAATVTESEANNTGITAGLENQGVTVTTVTNNDFVIAVISSDDTTVPVAISPNLQQTVITGANGFGALGICLKSTAGVQSMLWSLNNTKKWAAVGVGIKKFASVASIPLPPQNDLSGGLMHMSAF